MSRKNVILLVLVFVTIAMIGFVRLIIQKDNQETQSTENPIPKFIDGKNISYGSYKLLHYSLVTFPPNFSIASMALAEK